MPPKTKTQLATRNYPSGAMNDTHAPASNKDTPYETLTKEFVAAVRSQLGSLTGEIASRNKVIQENDAYIYDDLLDRALDVPVGHDRTPVNWLRRTVEIHRTQFMGRGFTVASSYSNLNPDSVDDPQAKQQLELEDSKRKGYAEARNKMAAAIMRDNNGHSLFAQAAESASAVGDAVIKAWFNEDKKKYVIQLIEATEHCFALWKSDTFREWDMFAYVYQLSVQEAQRRYNVGPDVVTSPLGQPLAVLSSANTVEYTSTQPMVTIMEITGTAQGYRSRNGIIETCEVGYEMPMNAIIVGDKVDQIIDEQKYMPHYYVLPNKRVRRRPWGKPDVTKNAIMINLSYIETLSDWRTLSSKANFPKFKAMNFPSGAQIPKPKARTIEFLPLPQGKDIQPLEMPNSAQMGQKDFIDQLEEFQNQFVREVAISRVLFDDPDMPDNSNRAAITAMKSIGDVVESKKQLWGPIIEKMFTDAFETLGEFDDNIKEMVQDTSDWHLRIVWPSMLNKEDPTYQQMLLNRFNFGTMSLQTFLEHQGETKEELDRLKEELDDPVLSAIHGKMLGALAEMKFFPPSTTPPKVNVNLRGDLTPEQEANVTYMHGMNQGPFGTTSGPQGNQGLTATDKQMNAGYMDGTTMGPSAQQTAPDGSQVQYTPNTASGQPQQQQPEQVNNPDQNQPGTGVVSTAGSGAPATSPQGKLNQHNQRKGG